MNTLKNKTREISTHFYSCWIIHISFSISAKRNRQHPLNIIRLHTAILVSATFPESQHRYLDLHEPGGGPPTCPRKMATCDKAEVQEPRMLVFSKCWTASKKSDVMVDATVLLRDCEFSAFCALFDHEWVLLMGVVIWIVFQWMQCWRCNFVCFIMVLWL